MNSDFSYSNAGLGYLIWQSRAVRDRVEEALTALERYLEDASLAGLPRVSVIHGLGTGALRDAVRSDAGAHPLVRTVRAGERGEGGDGVTVVELA